MSKTFLQSAASSQTNMETLATMMPNSRCNTNVSRTDQINFF